VGALTIRADGLGTWWELGETWTVWDTGELQAFNQPANQQANQSNSKPTDWPFCQPARLSNTTRPR